MFSRLFGKDKGSKSSQGGNNVLGSIEKIDSSIELLEKREALLEKKVSEEIEKAKAFYVRKNQNAALQCMKRKKMYEEQLQSYVSQKQNLETLRFTVQNQAMNQEVLKAQLSAKEDLKRTNKRLNADKIEENMDELMEEIDKTKQVSEALRQPLGGEVIDEDDLLQELELELELNPEKVESGHAKVEEVKLPDMPAVPSSKLPSISQTAKMQKEDEEELLKALEEKLAI
ncbi:unnamed protein product [Phytomonas sp. EM1]|nr:unnamed protein product [Phytomonas sp. EM1]|eukprot:CCW61173.1 unnamed protein product [Phytomonas sp. isolate EM1]